LHQHNMGHITSFTFDKPEQIEGAPACSLYRLAGTTYICSSLLLYASRVNSPVHQPACECPCSGIRCSTNPRPL
jgi:hypothetical protein